MVEKFQEIVDYMINDPEWDLPQAEKEAQANAIGMVIFKA